VVALTRRGRSVCRGRRHSAGAVRAFPRVFPRPAWRWWRAAL